MAVPTISTCASVSPALSEPRGAGGLAARLNWDRTATEILDAYTC